MSKNYVELVRNSTGGQKDAGTHKNQRAALDRLAKERGGLRLARIEALGVSGAKAIHETKAGQELLALAEQGFDEIRLWDLDRALGQRSADLDVRVAFFSIVKRAGAKIVECSGNVIEPESMIGELQFLIKGLFAADERKKIAARMNAGKQRHAAEGRIASGRLPYGWRKSESGIEAHPEQAEIIRRMFRDRDLGKSAIEIAASLNADRVPTYSGRGRWHPRTVRGYLGNRRYVGEYTYLGYTIDLPPLVDREVFDRVQARTATRDERGRKPTYSAYDSILKGRVWCSCGSRMYAIQSRQYRYFRCPRARTEYAAQGREKCDSVSHRADRIDPVVWAALQARLEADDFADLIDAPPDLRPMREQIAGCEKQLAKLERSELRALDMADDGALSDSALRRQLKSIQAKRTIVTRTKQIAQEDLAAAQMASRDKRGMKRLVKSLRKRLARGLSHAEKAELVREIIPRHRPGVVLHTDGKIEIRGSLQADSGNARAVVKSGRLSSEPPPIDNTVIPLRVITKLVS